MNMEIRADGLHICGYVNVTEKKSRPVITPHGKVVEEIEPRAFEQAINRAKNINVTVDHDDTIVYASTQDGNLILYEDNIGLHATAIIKDENLIDVAQKGKIKGWSFGMFNVKDTIETRGEGLPVRKIKELDLDHITLVVNKKPCYSATSVEIRADSEVDIEIRTIEWSTILTKIETKPLNASFFDNTAFANRAKALINNFKEN